ncbi:phosphatase PAP2 family protein [Candidatus Saccharibacteria bacterium]|nr:phosphatase PAP2 family protein [Candidatus Saccharibacteria bacterium]
MTLNKQKLLQTAGVAGTLFCIAVFASHPSFPTPDKLLLFFFFVFLIFNQASAMLKRLLPFVALILAYESFRGVADSLNGHVNYTLAPRVDTFLFGSLPTVQLQNILWHGQVSWYDFAFYVPYLLFFIMPLGLALLVWKTHEKQYWRVVSTFLAVFFAGFLTFLLLPAAPPWMASQNDYIEPVTRISSGVWQALGIADFPSFYSRVSPNPVAAVPSLHAAIATLFSIFIFKLYGRRWGAVSLIYPVLIYVGVVYQGEHYFFDILLGALYAVAGYKLVPKAAHRFKRLSLRARPQLNLSSAP